MHELSPATQAVLLLCGHFAPKEPASPLGLQELNRLVDALAASNKRLIDLLDRDVLSGNEWSMAKLERERVLRLLERGAAMALAVERWTSAGLWIVARGEAGYPARLQQHLGRSAPPLLFGVGPAAQLERGGLAIVGARDIDEEGSRFSDAVARQCAREDVAVVSGGARGVDEIALGAAFDEGGRVVAALPEGLGKASVAAKYREAIREERLVLVSPYAPHAPFSVGNAMGRNRLIYALADAALVVASAVRSGGTWAGAEEELRRERRRPLYVRVATPPIDGNEELLRIGGVPFPDDALQGSIHNLLLPRWSAPALSRVADGEWTDPASHIRPDPSPSATASSAPSSDGDRAADRGYEAVLPRLLTLLERPASAEEVAETLGVTERQAAGWLDRAVEEKRIAKSGRPARFRRTNAAQSSLFDDD